MLVRTMASALALTGVAYAQESAAPAQTETSTIAAASSNERSVYDAAFFAQFNPQTANDMVAQVPGFTLSDGGGRRGFSGAVGNLLIDGVRPTSKSQSASNLLGQIPASQVVRIEVLRGAAVAGDASGLSQLVNVVRTPNAGSGIWSTGFEYTARQIIAPRANLHYSGRNGQVEWGLGGTIYTEYRSLPGYRHLYNEPGDMLFSIADTPSPRSFKQMTFTGNLAFPLFGGRVSSNGQFDLYHFHADNDFFYSDPSGAFQSNLLSDYGERQPTYELGVNYDRDIGAWSMSMIGLLNRKDFQTFEDDIATDTAPAGVVHIVQNVDRKTGESILRGTLSRPLTDTQRIEIDAEAAYNSLEQKFDLSFDGAPSSIPNSNVLVEENRAEFTGVHTWRPNDRWTLETRLAWETSTLTFTGDTNDEVPLSFWKPSIQLSRNIGTNNQLRFRVYRDVGQLNFDDFVSASSIADAIITGGNPHLVPEKDWRAELGADWHFGDAALSLTLTRHWFSDVADLIPMTAPNPDQDPSDPTDDLLRFDGPGNIGNARATSLDMTFSTPLDAVLPGGRLTISGYLWDTDVVDPLTHRHRILSNRAESNIKVEFRQDISAWRAAWGVNLAKVGEVQAYRFNEIDTSEEGPYVDFFVETTALPHNMKLRLWAINFLDGRVDRDRRFFNAPDRTGPNTARDLRERNFDATPWLQVELSGTF